MKALAFFLLLHMVMATISGIAEGGGGVVTTKLTADLSATASSCDVLSTEGFLKKDYIVIGDEYISYTNVDSDSFLSLDRGWNDTEAKIHLAGTKVYSANADPLNAALGFNIMATGDTVGEVEIWSAGTRFLSTTLPRFVTWDYGILQVGAMTYVRTVLQILGGAFLVFLGLNIVGAFGRN